MPSKPSSTAELLPKTMPPSSQAMPQPSPEPESSALMNAAIESEITGYAKARERFLMEAFPKVYQRMEKDHTLGDHLQETGETAAVLFQNLFVEMTQKLRSQNLPHLELVAELKAVPLKANEIVLVPPDSSLASVSAEPEEQLHSAEQTPGSEESGSSSGSDLKPDPAVGFGLRAGQMTSEVLSSRIASLEDELNSVVTAKPGGGLWEDQVDDKSWILMGLEDLKAEQARRAKLPK